MENKEMENEIDYALTRMARNKLLLYSPSITNEEALDVIENKSIVLADFGDGFEYRLFFSAKDSKPLVAIIYKNTLEVVTIAPALRKNGDPVTFMPKAIRRVGSPVKLNSVSASPKQITACMEVAGISPLSLSNPDSPVFYLRKKPSKTHEDIERRPFDWVLHYTDSIGVQRIKNVKHQSPIEIPTEVPENILNKVNELLDKEDGFAAKLYFKRVHDHVILAQWDISDTDDNDRSDDE
jgi:hypothetical protein